MHTHAAVTTRTIVSRCTFRQLRTAARGAVRHAQIALANAMVIVAQTRKRSMLCDGKP
jgi:hypothetical protein